MEIKSNREILKLFKCDLGITSAAKDEFFTMMINASISELEKKFPLDLNDVEDMILVSDWTAWKYRKRQTDEGMPMNLRMRVWNRIAGRRADRGEVKR